MVRYEHPYRSRKILTRGNEDYIPPYKEGFEYYRFEGPLNPMIPGQ